LEEQLQSERMVRIANFNIKRILHPEELTESEQERIKKYGPKQFKEMKLLDEQRKVLEKFDQKKKLEDNSNVKSRATYLWDLKRFGLFVNKPFENVTKEDILNFLSKNESLKPSTINLMKIVIKSFFQWLYGMSGRDYPDLVKWITQNKNNSHKLPEEILTVEEIRKIADTADNQRDRALITVCYDSACRATELLSLKIKHVSFDDYGAVIMVDGKTGQRRIRLINSVPDLKIWLNQHPFKDNPEAPLWIDVSRKSYGKGLYWSGLYQKVRTLAKRAGIKKKVYPHLFRHSRLTELAKVLTEQELKVFAGWVRGSSMASVYVHLSGQDIDKKLLENAGLLKDDIKKIDRLKPKKCSRCNEDNSVTAKFCSKCYYPLEIDAVNQIEALRSYINEFLTTKLLQKPGFMEELPKLVEEWSKDGK